MLLLHLLHESSTQHHAVPSPPSLQFLQDEFVHQQLVSQEQYEQPLVLLHQMQIKQLPPVCHQ